MPAPEPSKVLFYCAIFGQDDEQLSTVLVMGFGEQWQIAACEAVLREAKNGLDATKICSVAVHRDYHFLGAAKFKTVD